MAQTIVNNSTSYVEIRTALAAAGEDLKTRFEAGESVVDLVHARATVIDAQLHKLWRHELDESGAALVAVGGYGRGELHPYSDVDVMVLLPDELPPGAEDALSAFIAALWDIGLEIGHSVRTIAQCLEEAKADLTVATTLMEARLLAGPAALFDAMQAMIAPDKMWPSTEFFQEKRKEQIARHHRYGDTAYNLEPNVKGSPGGLRDIQMIGWVAKRHFGASTLAELVDHKFLTPGQLRRLENGQTFLWRIRFGLHILTGRREDRLLFDYQIKLAHLLGYEDASYTLAVEQFMQRYYRTVMNLSRLNEMLLQLFEEAILMDPDAQPELLDDRFQIKNGFLQTSNDRVFANDPSALLELFLVLQQNPEIRGVSAFTVGLIRRNLHLIDDEFRQNPRNHRLFLSILRAPEGVTHELRRMNLYGVLGLYIPSFGRIVGRMQYDLFHAYTVDEHTLFVVSNLRRFALSRYDKEFPHCSQIMQSLEQPEIAYLGGLFHDIAKGRGGDHSELGAVDARAFCLEHGLSKYEAGIVAWLVKHHLILSTTAQKKDIGDPDVINEFASTVGDPLHLDYLYLLTVADVRGTNPKLWNSWKAQLFHDLYELTRRALRRGLENPIDREQLILEKQVKAREILHGNGLADKHIDNVWQLMNSNYFLRHRSTEIAWHTQWLADSNTSSEFGLLDVRRRDTGDGVEAVIYTPRAKRTFAHATAVLDELGMTIMDARIVPLQKGYSIDSFVFMELDDRVELDDSRLNRIRRALTAVLTGNDDDLTVTRTVHRQARMFTTRTTADFGTSTSGDSTVLEIVAADRPGLLSDIGRVFVEQEVDIEAAKIMTIGERAEDVFYISDEAGRPLDENAQEELRVALLTRLDSNLN
ncbi:MAG: [protein-PII] uridylyltransferase [Gammaproteobacteria bacterium]|nr:[protein-PII] uridylyltransferase [Gammaproteobacteria bacterium]MBT8109262.1 [protein-PII] uridylyltransferase [Gammaproteobacteria bacterium]NND46263.1 [protein-PII] uridylyltransferase [Woeseiaceae bacterium]NNL43964.1 [protein-PII] uridylyltransferase [Woeseiaceae bacterium]